jgi:tRNA(Ile)-lysidine synthase
MIIRPLIELSRAEIKDFLERKRQDFFTDETNLEATYLRNRIRLEILPIMKKHQPRLLSILSHTADRMREDDHCLSKLAEDWLKSENQSLAEGEVRLPVRPLLDLPPALMNRVFRQAILRIGENLRQLDRRHYAALKELLLSEKPQTAISLPRRLFARRSYENVIISSGKGREHMNFFHSFAGAGSYKIPELGLRVCLEEMDRHDVKLMPPSLWTAIFDLDRVDFPLIMRNFRAGDRFVPLGMSGRKKLKDLFIDLKIPSELRWKIPLLISAERLMWICGVRIDERFKLTPTSMHVLKISLLELNHEGSSLLGELSAAIGSKHVPPNTAL